MKNLPHVKTTSFLAEGTELEGVLTVKGGIRIDGTLKGDLTCDSVVFVGEHGHIEGEIHAEGLVSAGVVTGDVHTTAQVVLSLPGELTGQVETRQLVLEKGVHFDGTCKLLDDDQR